MAVRKNYEVRLSCGHVIVQDRVMTRCIRALSPLGVTMQCPMCKRQAYPV